MRLDEVATSENDLVLLLNLLVRKANNQQQPSYYTWDAFNARMKSVGDVQFNYDSFKGLVDANPTFKQAVMKNVKRYDGEGIELNTQKEAEKTPQGGEGEDTVAKMAKAATARRQG